MTITSSCGKQFLRKLIMIVGDLASTANMIFFSTTSDLKIRKISSFSRINGIVCREIQKANGTGKYKFGKVKTAISIN